MPNQLRFPRGLVRARPLACHSGRVTDLLRRLEEERAQTLTRLRALEASRDDVVAAAVGANVDDEHDPEGATTGFERAQVTALADGARAHLADVEAALGRVADGTYGRCELCGRPIAPARLEARPTATTCIDCARRQTRRR